MLRPEAATALLSPLCLPHFYNLGQHGIILSLLSGQCRQCSPVCPVVGGQRPPVDPHLVVPVFYNPLTAPGRAMEDNIIYTEWASAGLVTGM